MHELHEGKSAHVRTPAQAVAVGLAKARRAGIPVPENPNRGGGGGGGGKKRRAGRSSK
jgi:hypothetical protein